MVESERLREEPCGCRSDLVTGTYTKLCPDHDRRAEEVVAGWLMARRRAGVMPPARLADDFQRWLQGATTQDLQVCLAVLAQELRARRLPGVADLHAATEKLGGWARDSCFLA